MIFFTNRIITSLVVMIFITISHNVYAQDSFSKMRDLWKSKEYQEVLTQLIVYRAKPYGKTAEVDYMIGTSACRLHGLSDIGGKYLRWIIKNYNIGEKARVIITNELEICGDSTIPKYMSFALLRGQASVSGKTMYAFAKKGFETSTVKVVRDISPDEFLSRLFNKSKSIDAVESVKQRTQEGFFVFSTDHFVFASMSGQTQNQLQSLAHGMENTLKFYMDNYALPAPPHLITVYLVPGPSSLMQLAFDIHGIEINRSQIGYSYRDDLSISGITPHSGYGTLAHELFHLVVRNDYGDIPPWLDEGISALNEVAVWQGNRREGIKNWRGPVLKTLWQQRPTISQLVTMDWSQLDGLDQASNNSNQSVKIQAVNMAMARYFVLYLQENDQLSRVFSAFRNRHVEKVDVNLSDNAISVLSSELNMTPIEIDRQFTQWFRDLEKCSNTRCS